MVKKKKKTIKAKRKRKVPDAYKETEALSNDVLVARVISFVIRDYLLDRGLLDTKDDGVPVEDVDYSLTLGTLAKMELQERLTERTNLLAARKKRVASRLAKNRKKRRPKK